MVEVFKTDVHQEQQATGLLKILGRLFPLWKINFDLEDCDRILRVEGLHITPADVMQALQAKGHQCQVLE